MNPFKPNRMAIHPLIMCLYLAHFSPKGDLYRMFLRGTIMKIALITLILGLLSSCVFRQPEGETPLAQSGDIHKSFFINEDGSPKTFVCGWAPEENVGAISKYQTHNYNVAGHCNLTFSIEEKFLVGRLVDPTLGKDKEGQAIISIGINKHYYLENRKDSYGRNTKDLIKESGRSHWSARPYLSLDFSRINIMEYLFSVPSRQILNAFEVEWDNESNFLGFSVETVDPVYGSDTQMKIRLNFMEYSTQEDFERTPFVDTANARFINILHVIGKRRPGIDKSQYVGKWDTRKKHDIYLVDFPDQEMIQVATDSVETWNSAFEKIGHGRPFVVKTDYPSKHKFDMRYSSIVWVEDRDIAQFSPSGFAGMTADVMNGEIHLWKHHDFRRDAQTAHSFCIYDRKGDLRRHAESKLLLRSYRFWVA